MTLRLLLLFLAFIFINDAQAADDALGKVRAEFQRAYVAAINTTNNDTTPAADSDALRAYLLYPYLQQARIQHALATQETSETDRAAEDFLKVHGTEPVARDLRRSWYASLAKRQQWERYLANYREVDDPTLRCHALTAKVTLQRFDGLLPQVVAMWSAAPDSLAACEPGFTWLKAQSAWTPELIEHRVRIALAAGNAGFARQLIAQLPSEQAAPLETWAMLIERPRQALDAAILNPQRSIEPASLLDGWIRLARSDPDGAMQRYAKLIVARELPKETSSRYALELALVLSWNRRPETLNYFSKVRAADLDERGSEWYGRAAIWAGQWKLLTQIIDAMPATLRQQTRWRYWSARAREMLGDKASAKSHYAALLNDDNYYAALAAARIDQVYTPHTQALSVDETQLQTLAEQLPFKRAHELMLTSVRELHVCAYDEWRSGYTKLSASDRLQAIALASQWNWYDQVILTAAEQKVFGDYERLYPHPFDAEIQSASKLTQLPPELIYATLRQESIYRTDALSAAAAKGLMQLQAPTANRTARKWHLSEPQDLFDPAVNIPVGAAYLRDLYDRFDNKIPLVLAAYNAGPGTPNRWLASTSKDADVWIENIPYNETRIYVQRVLWHSVVFGWLMTHAGQDARPWLKPIEPAQH